MRSELIDTDGRLDKCYCGAYAKFICDTTHQPHSWRVDCTECPETTDWVFCQSDALTTWNKLIRSNTAKEETKSANSVILPCPFCGAPARVDESERCVECTKCTACTYCQDTVKPAIEQWNCRTKI